MSEQDELDMLRAASRLAELEAKAVKKLVINEPIPEPPSPYERFNKGMMDMYQGGRQLMPEGYGGYTDQQAAEVADNNQLYEKGYDYWHSSKDDKGSLSPDLDGFRLGGQAVASLPLMAIPGGQVTAGGRIVMGGLAGLTGGGLLYEEDMMDKAKNAGIGLAGGSIFSAVAPGVTQLAGKGYGIAKEGFRRAGNIIESINPKVTTTITPKLSEAFQKQGMSLDDIGQAAHNRLWTQADDSIKNTGTFDADALARKVKAENFGFIDDAAPTTGQVTRDGRLISKESNLSRSDTEAGGLLNDRFRNQRNKVRDVLKGFQKDIFGEGAEELTPYTTLNNVRKSVTDTADAMQTEVSAAYAKVPGGVSLNKESLINNTQQVMSDFADNIPSGVKTRINDIVNNPNKAFIYEDYVKLDQLITRTAGDSNADQLAARELKEAIAGVLDDSGTTLTGDAKLAYQQAKALAKKRFDKIGADNDLVGMLNNGKIDDQKFLNKITSGSSVDEITNLFNFVDENSKKQIRTLVLNDLIEKSTPSGKFSQSAYNKNLNKLAKEKLDVIFGKNHKKLKSFGDVARDLMFDDGSGATNWSNSAIESGNMVRSIYNGLIDFSPEARILTSLLSKGANKGAQDQAIVDLSLSSGLPKMQSIFSTKNTVTPQTLSKIGQASPMAGILATDQIKY